MERVQEQEVQDQKEENKEQDKEPVNFKKRGRLKSNR